MRRFDLLGPAAIVAALCFFAGNAESGPVKLGGVRPFAPDTVSCTPSLECVVGDRLTAGHPTWGSPVVPSAFRIWFPGSDVGGRGRRGEAWVDLRVSRHLMVGEPASKDPADAKFRYYRCRIPDHQPAAFGPLHRPSSWILPKKK